MFYNIDDLNRKKREDKEDIKYVVVSDLSGELKDLERLDSRDLGKIHTRSREDDYLTNVFQDRLHDCFELLLNKDLPFDGINVKGESGFLLSSIKHLEINQDFIDFYYNHLDEKYNEFRYDDNFSKKSNFKNFMRKRIKNLRITDLLYNYVPLKLSFEPYIYVDGDEISVDDFYDCNTGVTFNEIIDFNEFTKILNKNGFFFNKDKNFSIKTFDDYFEHLKTLGDFSYPLYIDVDLRDNNNVSIK